MWNYGGGYSCGMGNDGLYILKIVVIALVIGLVVSLIRRHKHGHRGCWGGMCGMCNEGGAAIDLLKERYVKGEIDRAEFEQKKKDLTN